MTDKNVLSPSVVEAIAGFTAGVISTLCFHPLDLIKTRLQGMMCAPAHRMVSLHESPNLISRYNILVDRQSSSRIGSSLRVISWIYRNEGGIAAFYRGLGPNLIGNSTSWALYFLSYSQIKQIMHAFHGGEKDTLGYSDYFIASGTAG